EEHKRLAGLNDRDGLRAELAEDSSSTHLPSSVGHLPLPSSLPSLQFSLSSDRGGGVDLAESLARLILEADPAIAGVGAAERPGPFPSSSRLPPGPPLSSMLSYQQQQHLLRRGTAPMAQDNPLMSIIKEVGLPKRPHQGGNDEGRDLSGEGTTSTRQCLLEPRPKQPMSHALNHQVNNRRPFFSFYTRDKPTFIFIIQGYEMYMCCFCSDSPLCRGPFPPGVSTVLSQIQRAPAVVGFPRGGPAPPLLPGGGSYRPYFGGPPPPLLTEWALPLMATSTTRHPSDTNTTHLHPQHRRMLTQRMQNRGGNLMTQKEKEWNYYEKMEKRQERERDSSKKEHTTKLITPQVAKVEHTYRPVQFAGSLGKLTVSSVNNPRKMIDAVVTTRTDDEEKREKQVWNKRRQILYTVEKMYSMLLEVQDFEKRFVQAPEEDREALLEQHKTNTMQLCNTLREKEWDDRVSDEQCVMIMSVRKGKRLISRLLAFLPSPQATAIVMAISRNLPALAKKDKQDQVTGVEPVSAVIQSLSSSALTDLLQELQGSEVGVTLLYMILSEGERMQSSDPNCQLMDDNRWTELVFSVTRELLSVPNSSLSPPLFTPPNLLSLFSRYVDRQRLELLQDKLQITTLSS
uniref:Protein PAT1 homolog 1 n=1 Tax=Cyclopterus lumpus TaxID=8103 RepID=A0A8C3AAZ9_CYCLU